MHCFVLRCTYKAVSTSWQGMQAVIQATHDGGWAGSHFLPRGLVSMNSVDTLGVGALRGARYRQQSLPLRLGIMAQTDGTGVAERAQLFQGMDKASTAYRLLSRMGWEEGQGLGAKKQGITSHIKVKKKFDSTGVGLKEQGERQRDWTTGMVHFDQILAGLKEVAARHESSDSSDSDDEDSDSPAKASTSSSDSEAEPPRKKAKGKAQKAVQKKKGKAAKQPSPDSDSTSSSGSSSEDEDSGKGGARKVSPGASKLATHLGRYHKRERAKSVRGYSTDDLAAILGTSAAEFTAPTPVTAPAEPSDPAWAPVGASKSSDDTTLQPIESDEEDVAGSTGAEGAEGAAPVKSWWSSMFVRAGRMGSTRHELHSRKVSAGAGGSGKIKVTGFSEQDQENLYTQAHLGATHNKQGLGQSAAPKKVAGARWSGTKTKLASDSDSDEQEGGGDSDSSSDDEAPGAVVVMASKKEVAEGHVAKEVLKLPPVKAPAVSKPVTKAEEKQAGEGKKEKGKSGKKEKESKAQEVEEPAGKQKKKEKGNGKDKGKTDVEPEAAVQEVKAAGKKEKGGKRKREVDAEDAGAKAGPASEEPEPKAKKGKKADGKEKKAKAAQQEEKDGGGGGEGGKVQWKKVAKTVLQQAPKQRLKVQQFREQVLLAAGLSADSSDKKLMAKVKSLPEVFEVGDKFVKLL